MTAKFVVKLRGDSHPASVVSHVRSVTRGVSSGLVMTALTFLFSFCGFQSTLRAQIQVVPPIGTVAGDGTRGYSGDGGLATSAQFYNLHGMVVDSTGNLYIADTSNHRVRVVDAATGMITTVAGNGTSGYSGDGGPAASAQLRSPNSVAVDGAGNFYIADAGNHVIRMVAAATGTINTVAGNGASGFSGDGGPATGATLNNPVGVALDAAGNLYIADEGAHVIRQVNAATGMIAAVAGNGTAGYSGDAGIATSAQLNSPTVIALDIAGNLYIADSLNHRVRTVTASTGIISTVAGSGSPGYTGDGGPAAGAQLNHPNWVAFDATGNLYIADFGNQVVREVDAVTGNITTMAGNGLLGYSGDGGPAISAEFDGPSAVAVDGMGNLFVSDSVNARIRMVGGATGITQFPTTAVGSKSTPRNILLRLTAAQTISGITAAKSISGKQEFAVGIVTGCTVDGKTMNASGATCTVPVTFQPAYPGMRGAGLLVSSSAGNLSAGMSGVATGPQVVFSPGTISTLAGNGTAGYSGDAGPAAAAKLNNPHSVAVDGAGNLYIADSANNRVRMVTAATGAITTVAGNGTAGNSGDGGAATSARLNNPNGVAIDSAGDLFISDTGNNSIREVTAATGIITTVTVSPTRTGGGRDEAVSAQLVAPSGIAVDSTGILYVADTNNHVIRRVAPASGAMTVFAGNGTAGFAGDSGAASSAELNSPLGVAMDSAGNLYIADQKNNRIRKVTAGSGIITTVAGNGTAGFMGDGGPATAAELNNPVGITVDSAGNLYIDDLGNNRIREVTAAKGTITTVAGNGTAPSSGDGGAATSAGLLPAGTAVDSYGNVYVAESNRIRKIDRSSLPSLHFATTHAGTTSSDSPQTVAIENVGNAALSFPPPASGSNPRITSNFSLGTSTTCPEVGVSSSAGTLGAGASCFFSVRFAPVAMGAISGSLTLTDNALNAVNPYATQAIALSGTAIGITTPTVTAAPSATSITTAQALTVAVAVSGGTGNPAPTGSVTLTGGGYTSAATSLNATGAASISIPAGKLAKGSDTLTISYTPDSASSSTYNPATGTAPAVTVTQAITTPTLTITPSAGSITTAQPLAVVIVVNATSGSPSPTGSVKLSSGSYTSAATALSSGSATINIPAGSLALGTDTLTVAYTPDTAGATYYNSVSGTASVTVTVQVITQPNVVVTPSASTITTAQPLTVAIAASAISGSLVPTGSVILTSGAYTSAATTLSNGTASIAIPAGSLAAGTDTLVATYTPDTASSSIFSTAMGSNSVTVTTPVIPTFTVTGTAVSVVAGATTANASTISVAPAGGFTGSVALAAALTSSPTGAINLPTFSLGSTSPVTITGPGSGIATLTITTLAPTTTTSMAHPAGRGVPWYAAGTTALACLLLFGIPARRRRWRNMLGMLVLLVTLAGTLIACGGGTSSSKTTTTTVPGTTAGTYTITVTGTSGSKTATGTVTLTVQ